MRRGLRATSIGQPLFVSSLRFGGARPAVKVDSNPLIAAQQNRTVSAVTPGKAFMLSWIASEQSASSITNRVVSTATVIGGGLLITIYGTSITSYSVLTVLLLGVYPTYFLYLHLGYWQVIVAAAALYLFLLFAN